MAIQVDTPESDRDYDDVRWYLLHRGVSVFRDADGAWYVEFPAPCERLDAEGGCRSYADRPALCREHGEPPETCEFHGPLYDTRFETPADLQNWLERRHR